MSKIEYFCKALLALLLLAAASRPAWTQEDAVRVEPLPSVRLLARAEEPLELDTFIRAAFIFSGLSEAQLPGREKELALLIDRLAEAVGEGGEPRRRAEAALTFMHQRLLKRYEEKQTRLDVLLDRGSFNCVSSGVLYAALVKALGLQVWGVRTADHAFCRVQAGEQAFDVETTSPFGFDPGSRKEFRDSFGSVTGYSYVPPSNYRDRRDIGERELLGLILHNRTAFLSERQSYELAVPPAVDAYALLGDGESYDRMITAFHNLSSWYALQGQFERAVGFLDSLLPARGEERLSRLKRDLLNNWTLSLVQGGRLEEAQELLDSRRSPAELGEQEWKRLTVYVFQLRAQEASRRDYREAARLIQEGLQKAGPDRELARSYEVYVHNAVVTLVRSERLQEALSVVEQALLQAPASAVLQEDRQKVLQQMGGR